MNECAKPGTPGGRLMLDFSTWGKNHRREIRGKKAKPVRKVILGSACQSQLLHNINCVSFSALFHIRVQRLCLPPPFFIYKLSQFVMEHAEMILTLTTHSKRDGLATRELSFRP